MHTTLSPSAYIRRLVEGGASREELFGLFSQIGSLISQYGSQFADEKVLSLIGSEDPTLSGLISSLQSLGLLTKESIGTLVRLTRHETGNLHIQSSHPELVKKKLSGPVVTVKKSQSVGVTVSGDGKIYKRTFAGDLDQLLN